MNWDSTGWLWHEITSRQQYLQKLPAPDRTLPIRYNRATRKPTVIEMNETVGGVCAYFCPENAIQLIETPTRTVRVVQSRLRGVEHPSLPYCPRDDPLECCRHLSGNRKIDMGVIMG